MKTAARFLLLAVLATADFASASAPSRTSAGRALAPSRRQPLAPAELGGGDGAAAQAAVAVTGGQAVEKVGVFCRKQMLSAHVCLACKAAAGFVVFDVFLRRMLYLSCTPYARALL